MRQQPSPEGVGRVAGEEGCMSGRCMSGQGHGTLTSSPLTGEEPAGQFAGRDSGDRERSEQEHGNREQRGKAGRDGPVSESALARKLRARGMVCGQSPAQVASVIKDVCGTRFGTTWIRAYRLALGITLADVVEQIRAWYEAQGREQPRFSETLLSAYESGQKRPGPEYLHYLCAVYGADPPDLGYQGTCFCGGGHRSGPGLVIAAEPPAKECERPTDIRQASAPARDGTAPDHEPMPAPMLGAVESMPRGADDDDVLRQALLQLIAGSAVSLDSKF